MTTKIKPQKRQVLLYPGDDGYFVVKVPITPGCISQGETSKEAPANIEEAIAINLNIDNYTIEINSTKL